MARDRIGDIYAAYLREQQSKRITENQTVNPNKSNCRHFPIELVVWVGFIVLTLMAGYYALIQTGASK